MRFGFSSAGAASALVSSVFLALERRFGFSSAGASAATSASALGVSACGSSGSGPTGIGSCAGAAGTGTLRAAGSEPPPTGASSIVMWQVRLWMRATRPRARGRQRFIVGPSSA